MLYAAIVACEIGFWVLLLSGLAIRYLLNRPQAGTAVLASVPLVDVGLLVLSVIDLTGPGTATAAHGLAAVYIGVSVAFGPRMLAWADQRFAHRFVGGPPQSRPPRYGREHARHERAGWYRHLLAWTIGSGLLLIATAFVAGLDPLTDLAGDDPPTGSSSPDALLGTAGVWTMVLAVDFLWSFSYTLWPRTPPRRAAGTPPCQW